MGLAALPPKQEQAPYRTTLRYIAAGRNKYKHQHGKTKQNRTRKYCTNSLVLCWRRTLDWRRSARRQALSSASAPLSIPRCRMPTFFAAVNQSPSIFDNNNECDPLPVLCLCAGPPRAEGLEIFMEAVHPRRRRSTPTLGPLHRQTPKHDSL